MPIKESSDSERDAAARPAAAHVSAFNAHLRLMPQAPGEYRVVLTFHDGDGQLYEGALTPLEASVLVSEIAHVLEVGDRQASLPESERSAG